MELGDVRRRLEALADSVAHLAKSDVVTRVGAAYRSASRTIDDPTPEMRQRIATYGADEAVPVPVVHERALQWRRDQLAGVEPQPSTLTTL